MAQDNSIIELKDYGLNWTMQNKYAYKVSEIQKDKSYMETPEIKIRFEDHPSMTITELRKPMSVPLFLSQTKKVLAQKSKGVKLTAKVNQGNAVLIERDYTGDDDRATIYKFMYGVIIKGKHYLIESNECDTQKECEELLEIARSMKAL
jgi:hypothetical protein